MSYGKRETSIQRLQRFDHGEWGVKIPFIKTYISIYVKREIILKNLDCNLRIRKKKIRNPVGMSIQSLSGFLEYSTIRLTFQERLSERKKSGFTRSRLDLSTLILGKKFSSPKICKTRTWVRLFSTVREGWGWGFYMYVCVYGCVKT